MPRKKLQRQKWSGILFIALFSFSALYLAEMPIIKQLSISPLIVGIALGMVYANSLRVHLPDEWVPGVIFCTKSLLRWGIILYGMRLTYQDVASVGMAGLSVDVTIVATTLILGMIVGRALKIDGDLTLLTATGSSICGAAAVLGTEPVLKSEPYKTAIAVATVVIFGTIAMFLYPILYRSGVTGLSPTQMGIFSGSTLHEVAHAVGAGDAMGPEVGNIAVIVKMLRVILLAPVLLLMALIIPKIRKGRTEKSQKAKITIPWFAFGFLVVIGINSLQIIPEPIVDLIKYIDTLFLTMAMTALGVETNFSKFKQAGPKPFLLAFILFIWLMGGGFLLSKYVAPIFG